MSFFCSNFLSLTWAWTQIQVEMNYRYQNFAVICRPVAGTGPAHEAVMRGMLFRPFTLLSAHICISSSPSSRPIWNPPDQIIMAPPRNLDFCGGVKEQEGVPGRWKDNKRCSIVHPRVPELNHKRAHLSVSSKMTRWDVSHVLPGTWGICAAIHG